MKSFNIVVSIIFVAALLGFLWTLSIEKAEAPEPIACTMEAKICPDGSSVGRTGPNCEFAPCPETPVPHSPDVVVEAPREGTTISSPVTINGTARGSWFFEGSFPVTVVDWDGRIIGEGIASAQGDWMTSDMVPFIASVSFELPIDTPYRRGAIILKKDNPSGLPENDDALEFPVLF